MTTEATRAAVLVVDACADTEALLERAGVEAERSDDAATAINRVEAGDALDVIVLAPRLEDPVRVAQRLHSLDRQGAIVILANADRAAELRHALEVAPFLGGDVSVVATGDPAELTARVAEAAARTRERRERGAADRKRRETPPPLGARYLGTLLDSAPIGIVTLDAEGAVVGWNQRAGEMFGTPEVEALGSPFSGLFDEGDRAGIQALIGRLGSAGLGGEGEIVHRGERAFELTGARFRIRSGEHGALVILQDVTKRVEAERKLALERALLEAQAESAVAGIAVVSQDGSLERMNRRWTEMWGVDAEMVRNDRERATQIMLDQVEDPEAFTAGIEALAGTARGEFKDEIRLKDGRTVERYAAHVRTEDGEIVGRIWFHTDITERKREEDALRFLADATKLLSSSLDYEVTLRSVAELAVPRIADWCSVEVIDARGPGQVAVAHVDPEKVQLARELRERYPDDPETGAVGIVMRTGEPLVYREIPAGLLEDAAVDEEHLRLLRELRLQSAMVVPIQIRGRNLGAITLVSAESAHTYDDDDLRLAQELARRAAIAIDNSRAHAALRDTARTLQESLLPPHLPGIDGVELAARFRPAGAGTEIGGDFYDIFDTAERQWCIAVGDVCGKGAHAAALTALTRYTVRVAATYEETTGGVLAVLNSALLHQRGDYRFTTLAFCVLEMGDRPCKLRATTGGHPRPLLLRADGSVRAIGSAGPLLGVFESAEFGEERVSLHDGDVIVLYTDGLTDAHAPDRMLSEADVVAALTECVGASAGEIALHLEHVALGGGEVNPRDDLAVLVAKIGE